jgi:predicted component of type VI protein secretion system
MTVDRVGQEAPEDEVPIKVSSVAEAFEKFKPGLQFKTTVGDEGTEFAADLEFKSLKDFDPKAIRTREPGKRNDIADLQAQIDLLHRMRDRFTVLAVKRAWEAPDQRREIIAAVGEFQDALRRLSEGGAT